MKVLEIPNGRLGNSLFRYFASIILITEYNAKRIIYTRECYNCKTITINDGNYHELLNSIEKNPEIFSEIVIILDGYFQYDTYSEQHYRKKIIQYIKNNPNDIIYGTDLNRNLLCNTAQQIMYEPKNIRKYDIVFHIRLEDFVDANLITHPNTLIKLINEISLLIHAEHQTIAPTAAIVCNKITTEFENKYIKYIYDNHNTPIQLQLENNDVITDFHIMKNASILVCSISTLSWCAALLSENVKTVYVPKNKTAGNQTFLRPIENTIIYENDICSKNFLNSLLNA